MVLMSRCSVPGFHTSHWELWSTGSIFIPSGQKISSHGLRAAQVPFGRLPVGCQVHFSEEWLLTPFYHKGLTGGVLVVLLYSSPISTKELWISFIVTTSFLVPCMTTARHPQLLSLAAQPDLVTLLVVLNFFHVRMMEATFLLGTLDAAEIFLHPPSDLWHNPDLQVYRLFPRPGPRKTSDF